MKLRIKGNSLRFRLSKSDVARLAQSGEITETVYLGPAPELKLSYALKVSRSQDALSVSYAEQTVTVSLSSEAVGRWAGAETEVGIYGRFDTGRVPLELMIEKDFACLDRSEKENEDTFSNPTACQPALK
jgi:hypothetical protein